MWLCDLFLFLNSANQICRGTDISKYFRESLGLWDNESRLYVEIYSLANFVHPDEILLKEQFDKVLHCRPLAGLFGSV